MTPDKNTTNTEKMDENLEAAHHDVEIPEDENSTENTTIIMENLQTRIHELETEIAAIKQNERDIALRAKAEVENVRRRAEMDVEKAHKFALEKFASALLPVVDNLERGLELVDKTNVELDSLREGIELTLKSLLDALEKAGITVINENNVPFNPEFHEAMTVMPSPDHQPNHIVMVLQKGYSLNGRLIRPARVAIAQ